MKGKKLNQVMITSFNRILTDIERVNFSANHPELIHLKEKTEAAGIDGIHELGERVVSINQKIESLNWMNNHLRILADFAQACAKTLNEDVLLRKAYELVSLVMPTDAFYFALYNEQEQLIHIPFLVDEGTEYRPNPLQVDNSNMTSRVIKSRKTLHTTTQKDLGPDYAVVGRDVSNTCIFVPLIIDDQVKGVISAQCHEEFAYRKEHEELLLIIGNQVLSSIETARLYKKIYEMSLMDEMTGLGNFRAFHKDFSMALQQDTPLALIMIDSDNLKEINDHFGHEAGDNYLIELAQGMKSLCDEDIKGYRYAGDEFMLIVANSSLEKINHLIKQLEEYLCNHGVSVSGKEIKVSFSAGASNYPKDGRTEEVLKRKADKALYRSKSLGRNVQLVLYAENE
ncbi:diguanylate cyclase domain-containing protein [Cytobacillus sp. Hz8]|uniref:sensor domain-containing diguanylate cyclase n=1 Tax=Cytobacillus sp. Hz8 TaxID=3347168 RepID=UPI0035DFCF32